MNMPEIIERYRPELEEQVKSQDRAEPYPSLTESQWHAMRSYLHLRGLSHAVAVRNGWYPTSELDGKARVVIPCSNEAGVPFWQARAMFPSHLRYRSARGGRNRSVCVVWPRGSMENKKLVVVEGPMDALAAATHGQVGLATLGANFCDYAVDWVVKARNWRRDVLVIPDADVPDFGVRAMAALLEAKVKARIVLPLGSKDLASMGRSDRRALMGLNNKPKTVS